MLLILLLDTAYWIVVLAGLVLTLRGKRSKRERIQAGAVSLVVLVLGLPISGMLWPLDWLARAGSTPASATYDDYTVSYIQRPGSDFYIDTVEITGDNGKMAVIHINVDNGKCWVGWAETSDREIEFHCFPWGTMAAINTAWLEQHMELCNTDPCDLSEAYFAIR